MSRRRRLCNSSTRNTFLTALVACSSVVVLLPSTTSFMIPNELTSLHLALTPPSTVTTAAAHFLPLVTTNLQGQVPSTLSHSLDVVSSSLTMASSTASSSSSNMLEVAGTLYRQELQKDPLKTKVLTGIVLAIVGDALAQTRTGEDYNRTRAVSFAIFDGCYRAVQQFTYPPMMKLCSGKFLGGLIATTAATTTVMAPDTVKLLAAIEQTLVSQLVIIPTLYYPVFYAITGAVQGLTVEETIQRAKETFLPLMKRNLLFWIPVQFIAFEFIEENLQIPILIVCGLVWTIILSVSAGAAASTAKAEDGTIGNNESDSDTPVLDKSEEPTVKQVNVLTRIRQNALSLNQKDSVSDAEETAKYSNSRKG